MNMKRRLERLEDSISKRFPIRDSAKVTKEELLRSVRALVERVRSGRQAGKDVTGDLKMGLTDEDRLRVIENVLNEVEGPSDENVVERLERLMGCGKPAMALQPDGAADDGLLASGIVPMFDLN